MLKSPPPPPPNQTTNPNKTNQTKPTKPNHVLTILHIKLNEQQQPKNINHPRTEFTYVSAWNHIIIPNIKAITANVSPTLTTKTLTLNNDVLAAKINHASILILNLSTPKPPASN